MALLKKGILGGISGKVGNVVGGTWKGIDYIRSLASSVANPRSPGQVTQRTKFSAVVEIGSQLLGSIIQPFWNGKVPKMSGFNAFVQQNIDSFTSEGVAIWNEIFMSKGSLLAPVSVSITSQNNDGDFVLQWVDNGGVGNALSTDLMSVVAYNEGSAEWFTLVFGADRSLETIAFTIPFYDPSSDTHIYLFASRLGNNAIQSNIVYLLG